MPLKLIRNDITKVSCDAIVNAANSTLLGGGGVDGAIHKAAGRGLLLECMKLGGCKPGQAKITGGYRLPCKYVIHTVGPKWRGGKNGEKETLRSCYRESLRLAEAHGCESVAFPLISAGVYGYPKAQAFRVAVDTITEYLVTSDLLVYLVIFDTAIYQISEKLYGDIAAYIDDCYVEQHTDTESEQNRRMYGGESMPLASAPTAVPFVPEKSNEGTLLAESITAAFQITPEIPGERQPDDLEQALQQLDESFSEMLLRKIDEKGMTDAACYKKANIDRKLFSKIRSNRLYKPSKPTALAFAVALELPLEETKDLLQKAGLALSHSSKFDIIVEYFICHGVYDIFEINEALFAFDQNLLGS